jgi:ABC-type antimicrobial peptide transport system permease subunit
MALGAHQPRILRMVLRQGAVQVIAGLAIGMSLAFLAATLAGNGIQNVLYGVTARDPLTYGAVSAVIAIVAFMATLVPARRATRVDPIVALRAD